MPSSYQAPMRGDKPTHTYSQTTKSNFAMDHLTVARVLEDKGNAVYSIRRTDTCHHAVEELAQKRIGALMVTDEHGKMEGILSERDIVRKLSETPDDTLPKLVQDVMTSDVKVCHPNESLVSVLRRMTDGRFRHMPVMDHGRLVGIITIGDVVNRRLKELELEALKLKQMIVG